MAIFVRKEGRGPIRRTIAAREAHHERWEAEEGLPGDGSPEPVLRMRHLDHLP
ncbi:MAG: hypothetical protein JXB39_12340 [Deltaproteobacteria bacterium]|nr:hypothetical protein [Deltaproteobacteria bacterium]